MKNITRIFAALSSPVRLTLCEIMARHEGILCVDQLLKQVNARLERDMQQPTISSHLRILENAGLIYCHQSGNWRYYSFESEAFEQAVHAARLALVFSSRKEHAS